MTEAPVTLSADELKARGADRFDPVRFAYIEAMMHRALEQRGPVRQIIQGKAEAALQAYQADFARQSAEARCTAARVAPSSPDKVEELNELLEQCQFRRVQRLATGLERATQYTAVAALTERISRGERSVEGNPGEMESTRRFRDSLARVNADKLLARAIENAPESPGPLNPEMLAIRSLTVMRELSPHYLSRFVSYIDTLLWLEQAARRTRSQSR